MSGRTHLLSTILLTLLAISAGAGELQLHQELAGAAAAGPPRVFGDTLIFTYQFDRPERSDPDNAASARRLRLVQIAFEHEHYAERRSFVLNDQEVYVFTMPVPRDRSRLRYRLIVNGLWTADPFNPQTVISGGIPVSVVDLPPPPPPSHAPVVSDDGRVEFLYRGEPGSRVLLVGDFNGWDPYMHRLRETEPGRFSITLQLVPGVHAYYFVVDGVRMVDPLNEERTLVRDRLVASSFVVP